MKVRLHSTFAAPDGTTGQAGDILDLPDDRARSLLEADPPAAEEVKDVVLLVPGTLTQAGSFGGTPAGLDTSGQTPGVAAAAPDPLLPREAFADGLAIGQQALPDDAPPEDTVNREAIDAAAETAPEGDPAADRDAEPAKKSRRRH